MFHQGPQHSPGGVLMDHHHAHPGHLQHHGQPPPHMSQMSQHMMQVNSPSLGQQPAPGVHGSQQSSQQLQQATAVVSQPQTSASATNSAANQVSLSVLIEYLVQKVYHELNVLAELLPRKTDMERKVMIFQFAARSRMLFVRLLALVKWASSASKVDKCNKIMDFLDRQAMLFTDTADALAQMARETLVRATLPNFHLPAAVEVLTTGYYSRIPKCVRERIVPPKPITALERKDTLLRLNQVIEHRLVTTKLPLQMRNLKIENGQVTFVVKNEFAASLTLMGDAIGIPWRLLKIEVLVEDKETGEGKSLVHPLQVGYLESLIQQRLAANETLDSLYVTLHSFCQSLQLEVLHNQTLKLCMQRLGKDVRIEEYRPGKCLTISYWRELMHRTNESKADNMKDLGYRFSIQVDPHDANKPLSIIHMPPLNNKDLELTEKVIRSENLSMERLLVHSIYVRTRARLSDLKVEIQEKLLNGSDMEASLHGTPPVLSIPILQPCLRSELLLVTIDIHTGIFMVHVPQYEDNPMANDIQQCLNDTDKSKLDQLVSQLRFWMTKQRVRKTLQQLPATSHETLPIFFDLNKHPLKDLSQNKMYVQLDRQPNAIIIVEFHENPANKCDLDYSFYLLWVKPASIEDDPKDDTVQADIPKVYLKAMSMVEFDPFLVTHGSETKVDVQDLTEKIIGKRKSSELTGPTGKRSKHPAYFINDLAHVVAFADEQIPFNALASELSKKGISHSGIQVIDKAVGLELRILHFPNVEGVPVAVQKHLQKFLINVVIRMQQRQGLRFWRTEIAFVGNPIGQKVSNRSVSFLTQEVNDNTGETVDALLQEWSQIVHLFHLVDDLEDYLSCDTSNISDLIGFKTYTFRELILEYGPNRFNTVKVLWNASQQKFSLIFGEKRESTTMNAHNLVKTQLEHHLNQHRNLALLGKILHETHGAIKALSFLPTTPVTLTKINPPNQTFSIIPQSPTHFKVVFYSAYCLDIYVRSDCHILVRDAAHSLFTQGQIRVEFEPIPFIKNFLLKYVDEATLQRRQSQAAEDDNPPSPLATASSTGNDNSDQATSGLKFHAPHTPPSNPLTPASPHGILQSPPASNIRQPSPAPQQPTPSPGFMAPSPVNNPSVGSPFPSAASPMAVGSPGMPRPSPRPLPSPAQGGMNQGKSHAPSSRLLPQRIWAGATPTALTSKALEEICKPSPLPPTPNNHMPPLEPHLELSPLHRFFGVVYLRKFIQEYIKSSDNGVQSLPLTKEEADEYPGLIKFRVGNADSSNQQNMMQQQQTASLICRVISYASNQHQSLHLKLESADQNQAYFWNQNPTMLTILERFFDSRVAIAPFRLNAVNAFLLILQTPLEVLKDLINILRYEIAPETLSDMDKQQLMWNIRLCLTVPPATANLLPMGRPGIFNLSEKMILFFHLTRMMRPNPNTEPMSVVVPIVYDIKSNTTTIPRKDSINNPTPNPVIIGAQNILVNLTNSQQWQQEIISTGRCTILPSLQQIIANLTLPNERPPGPQPGPGGMMMQHQMVRPPMGPGPQMGPGGPPMRMMMPPQQQRMMMQPQHGYMN